MAETREIVLRLTDGERGVFIEIGGPGGAPARVTEAELFAFAWAALARIDKIDDAGLTPRRLCCRAALACLAGPATAIEVLRSGPVRLC